MSETTASTTLFNTWTEAAPELDRLAPVKPTELPAEMNQAWLPLELAALNRKTPLVYEVLNPVADLPPAADWMHAYKIDAAQAAPAWEQMNPASGMDFDALAEANRLS